MFRFAVLPYANAAPLVHFLPGVCPGAELLHRPPRDVLPELAAGRADAGIVSVVDFLASPWLQAIGEVGIAARGEVRSVLLRCRRPIGRIKTVALDPESRTANALAGVLLADRFRLDDVQMLPAGSPADAAVVIGDRALCSPPARFCLDLAGEWHAWTHLPFLFAVWACRRDHPQVERLGAVVREARLAGGAAIPRLAALCAARLGLPVEQCRQYLSTCIHYDIGPPERDGLKRFAAMLAGTSSAGLSSPISELPQEVRT